MTILTCVNKIRDKNNAIITYTVKSEHGEVYNVSANKLKEEMINGRVRCTNLRLTKDNRLIDIKNTNSAAKTYENKLRLLGVSGDFVFTSDYKVLLRYRGNKKTVSIPTFVQRIGESCFQDSNIEEVIIPNSVTVISPRAFYKCKNLCKVNMSNSVRIIGKMAFGYCEALTEFDSKCVELIDSWAFSNCSHISKFIFSKRLRVIGEESFYNCARLDYIDLPDSVTDIKANAFSVSDGYDLKTVPYHRIYDESTNQVNKECNPTVVKFGKGIKNIGERAFSDRWIENI